MKKIQHLKTFLGMNRWQTSLFRASIQDQIDSYCKSNTPIDFYQSLRFPKDARIVFYSNDLKAEMALKSLFPDFELLNPSDLVLGESDQVLSSRISESLVQSNNPGVFLKGYPFNANQALLLDKKLRGVNLAIYFQNKDSSYESSIQDILNYYERSGTLLRWELKENLEQTMLKLRQAIVSQIKLN